MAELLSLLMVGISYRFLLLLDVLMMVLGISSDRGCGVRAVMPLGVF